MSAGELCGSEGIPTRAARSFFGSLVACNRFLTTFVHEILPRSPGASGEGQLLNTQGAGALAQSASSQDDRKRLGGQRGGSKPGAAPGNLTM